MKSGFLSTARLALAKRKQLHAGDIVDIKGIGTYKLTGNETMLIHDIRLLHFRNYDDERVEFPSIVVLYERTDRKTNLLEALYMASIGKSIGDLPMRTLFTGSSRRQV